MVAQPTTQPGSKPGPRKITLDQAVEAAVNSSKQLQLAAEAVNRARGRINEAKTGYMPSLAADYTLQRLNQGITSTFPDENGNPVSTTIVAQNQQIVNLLANLPIDILGQIRTAVDQTEFQWYTTRLDFNRVRNELVQNVKVAFFDVLRARDQVGVGEQALKNAQDRLRITEANLRAGTGTKFDVLRAQTEVANAEQSLISTRNRVNLLTATLNNLLNFDQNTPLEPEVSGEAKEPQSPQFDKELEAAYKTRPEALQAETNIRAAEKGIYLAQRSQLPTLGLGWNFQYNPNAGAFGQETQWTALAKVNLPIFDQGLSKARTQQAKADANSAKINKQVTLDTIALEVRQSLLAVLEAQDRLRVTSAAVTQAQEQYRLAQVRFTAGVTLTPGSSPLLEISDAQTALTQAQNNEINAQYDLQQARARLDRAAGRYAFDGKAQPGVASPAAVKK
jgi:outer membrane protein TolC